MLRRLAIAALAFSPFISAQPPAFCTPGRCGAPPALCIESVNLCICPPNRAGTFCEVDLCTGPLQGGLCLDIVAPTIRAPPLARLECDATDLSPTPGGTGAPFLSDNCPVNDLKVTVTNNVTRRSARDCPNSATITRTFNVTDRCGNSATATQRIVIDDTTAPVVRARLVPLPLTNAQQSFVGAADVQLNQLLGDKHTGPGSVLTRELRPFSADKMFTTTNSLSQNQASAQAVAVCNPPAVRSFMVACNISDACSARRDIRVQARLRVSRILNRNAFTTASTASSSKGNLGGSFDHMKPFATPQNTNVNQESDNWIVDTNTQVTEAAIGSINNRLSDSNQFINYPVGNSIDLTGVGSNNFNNINLGLGGSNNHASGGSSLGGVLGGLLGGNHANTPIGSAINDFHNTEFLRTAQCAVGVDFVDVNCGDIVQIELEREDACLADDFVSGTPFTKMVPMSFDHNEVTSFLARENLSSFSSSFSRPSALSIRGTFVDLQVRAADECGNLAADSSSTSDSCDGVIAGRCCPSIAPVARVVRTQPVVGASKDVLGGGLFGDKLNQLFGGLPNIDLPLGGPVLH